MIRLDDYLKSKCAVSTTVKYEILLNRKMQIDLHVEKYDKRLEK